MRVNKAYLVHGVSISCSCQKQRPVAALLEAMSVTVVVPAIDSEVIVRVETAMLVVVLLDYQKYQHHVSHAWYKNMTSLTEGIESDIWSLSIE